MSRETSSHHSGVVRYLATLSLLLPSSIAIAGDDDSALYSHPLIVGELDAGVEAMLRNGDVEGVLRRAAISEIAAEDDDGTFTFVSKVGLPQREVQGRPEAEGLAESVKQQDVATHLYLDPLVAAWMDAPDSAPPSVHVAISVVVDEPTEPLLVQLDRAMAEGYVPCVIA